MPRNKKSNRVSKQHKNSISIAAYFVLLFIAVFSDQLTKFYIHEYFITNPGIKHIDILPFLRASLVWNFGISFSILNDATQNQFLLIMLAAAIVIYVNYTARKMKGKAWIPACFITGGAIGNILDRIQYGAVLDFIDVHAYGYHYPTFNIADSFIVIGAALFIWENLKK